MLPYINIGQIQISTYYSAMILGYLMMIMLMLLKARRKKYNINKLQSVLFATAGLISGILGCKILFILENIAWIKNNGFTFGGFSFYGAVLIAPLLMPLIGKILGLNLRESLDNTAICITAMLGTIRLGCFLNGCCGGILLNIGDIYFSFPAQLIECVCDFAMLFILIKCEKKEKAYGFLYSKMLLIYGCVRFIIEFFRTTEKDWLYLSHAQWFSIAAIITGTVFEIILIKQLKKSKYPTHIANPNKNNKSLH